MIHKGDKLRILPQWQDVGDDTVEWEAVEDSDGNRVRIRANLPGMVYKPQSVILTEWCEVINGR